MGNRPGDHACRRLQLPQSPVSGPQFQTRAGDRATGSNVTNEGSAEGGLGGMVWSSSDLHADLLTSLPPPASRLPTSTVDVNVNVNVRPQFSPEQHSTCIHNYVHDHMT